LTRALGGYAKLKDAHDVLHSPEHAEMSPRFYALPALLVGIAALLFGLVEMDPRVRFVAVVAGTVLIALAVEGWARARGQ
jgi:uncharacterized membrane protein